MRSITLRLLAVSAVLVWFAALSVTPAQATQTCHTSSHCYDLVQLGPTSGGLGFLGVELTLHAPCMKNSNGSTDFVTVETWISYSSYWIEAGIAWGYPQGNQRYYFWADQRPAGGGYHEHDDTNDDPGSSDVGVQITTATSTSFYVKTGPLTGQSTGWSSSTLFTTLQTGSESTASGASTSLYASSRALAYFGRSDNYHAGWNYSAGSAYGYRDPSDWDS